MAVVSRKGLACAFFAALMLAASVVPARAQAGPSFAGTADFGNYLEFVGGMAAVQNVGGLAGMSVGRHRTRSMDFVAEALWVQDIATRRQLDSAESLGVYLAQTQGRATTATVDGPTWFVLGGARFFFGPPGMIRPYVLGEGGFARVTLRPAFTLAGSDVTGNLDDYGVSLGSDLTGTSYRPAFGAVVGVVVDRGRLSLDGGLRLTSVQITGHSSNVLGAGFGIGYGF